MVFCEFKRGDIVDLIGSCSEKDASIKQYNQIAHLNPHKLIILRKIDDSAFLVAFCKKTPKRIDLIIETKEKIKLFICADKFFSIDERFIRFSNLNFRNPQKIVGDIYQKHNEIIEEKKKKREQQKQNELEKKEKREARRKLVEAYAKAYEIAIINNDKEKMRQIISTIGYAPGQSSKGYATLKDNSSNKHFNPKPLSGGGFTPK